MKAYKIQHRDTELFSSGGIEPTWSKSGKLWKTIGYAKTAITNTARWLAGQAIRIQSPQGSAAFFEQLIDLENWDIIEYEMMPTKYHQVIPGEKLTDEIVQHLKDKGFEMT